MELQDTIELMNSSDFRDRFKAEYFQLKIRFDKLNVMLNKMKNNQLEFKPKCNYDLLRFQADLMYNYLSVLKERAKLESIDLGE